MIDRVINLTSLLSIVAVITFTSLEIYNAWNTTYLWDAEWELPKEKVLDQFDQVKGADRWSPKEIVSALKSAKFAGDHSASNRLEKYLFKNYVKTEKKIRFNDQEKKEIVITFLISLLSLLVPFSINYVKHGKFRLWNSST